MPAQKSADLIAKLSSHGLRFRNFSVSHEGAYSMADAEWNYKDTLHITHVHTTVDAVIGNIQEHSNATINFQNILGMRFPIVVYNYDSGGNTQTYFTTF